jgi:hypothetical protein
VRSRTVDGHEDT